MKPNDLLALYEKMNIETQYRIMRGAEAAKKTIAAYMVSLLSRGVNTYPDYLCQFGVNT